MERVEYRIRRHNRELLFMGYGLILFSVLLYGINYTICSYFSLDTYIIAENEYRTNCHNNSNNKIHSECPNITIRCNTYYLIEQQERAICHKEIKEIKEIKIIKYFNKEMVANLSDLCDNLKNTYLETCLKNYDDTSINKFYIKLKKSIPELLIGCVFIYSFIIFCYVIRSIMVP